MKNLKYYLLMCHMQSLSKENGLRGEGITCNAKLELSWSQALLFSFWKGRRPQLEMDAKAMSFSGFPLSRFKTARIMLRHLYKVMKEEVRQRLPSVWKCKCQNQRRHSRSGLKTLNFSRKEKGVLYKFH